MVFLGLLGRNDNAFTLRNGWHHTGDMGAHRCRGLPLVQRALTGHELIKPGGENVYPPGSRKRVILEHPVLAQAVAFGAGRSGRGRQGGLCAEGGAIRVPNH